MLQIYTDGFLREEKECDGLGNSTRSTQMLLIYTVLRLRADKKHRHFAQDVAAFSSWLGLMAALQGMLELVLPNLAVTSAVSRVLCLSRDIDLLVSDTKAISEVNSKLGSNGRPEYLWPDPLGCNITKNEPDEFRCCLIAGEVSPQLHSLSNSTV